MSIDLSQFYSVFFDETAEHLDSMEHLLLNIDVGTPSNDDLNAIFRVAHSIKGGAATFGFNDLKEVTHVLESHLDTLRRGEAQLRDDMVDLFLRTGDALKQLLARHRNGQDSDEALAGEITAELQRLDMGAAPVAADAASETDALTDAPSGASVETASEGTDIPMLPARVARYRIGLRGLREVDVQALRQIWGAAGELLESSVTHEGEREIVFELSTGIERSELVETLEFVASGEHWSIESLDDPAASGDLDGDGFGLFLDNPGISGVELVEEGEGFGIFKHAPGSESLGAASGESMLEGDGFGFFADAPGLEPASTPAATAMAVEGDGFGFFEDPAVVRSRAEAAASEPAQADTAKPAAAVAPAKTAAPAPKAPARENKPAAAASQGETSIRVSVEKVDQLINLVGELVITQSMIAQIASNADPVLYERLIGAIGQLERNSRDMQEAVMSIRMMPMSVVFSRFPRMVRDLAAKLSKQVELVTIGESTELDKGLIEKISDPLTHLIRNSIDHGLETPAEREAAGKPAKGTVTLEASHQGGNIVIEIADDGKGLNRDKIIAKAIERGLPASESMPDQDVWQLIFMPGFSTADQVTEVSGRGVGMDVVKRNVEGLGGRIELQSTQGQGTRTIIRLPLTLAILDGMTIAVGEHKYILPMSFIIESLQPRREDVKTLSGRGRVLNVRGEYLPIVTLSDVFHLEPRHARPWDAIVVVVETDECRVALQVDELLGQQQVVIKSLESNYRRVPGISGATIMGDGRVALILDVAQLVRLAQTAANDGEDMDLAAQPTQEEACA